jgi:hypothetical protein
MDRDDDVERLFSWIKTPDLHYREFAAEREVADTTATWPVLRDAVAEPSLDERLEPGTPHEGELMPSERARHGDHPAEVFGHHEPPAHHPAEPPVAREEETAGEVPWATQPPQAPPTFARREPPPPEPPPVATQYQPPPPPPRPEPQANQQYRGFEDAQTPPPPAEPAQAGKVRSLDSIFSRVARPTPAARDEPTQASTGPGLGPVFRRLR